MFFFVTQSSSVFLANTEAVASVSSNLKSQDAWF